MNASCTTGVKMGAGPWSTPVDELLGNKEMNTMYNTCFKASTSYYLQDIYCRPKRLPTFVFNSIDLFGLSKLNN